MSTINLLRKFGFYIDEQFLSVEECVALRMQMDNAATLTAGVSSASAEVELRDSAAHDYIDVKLRQSEYRRVSTTLQMEIAERVKLLQPKIESHFDERYDEAFELPKFLIYQPGDFFKPHVDIQYRRKINMTIYLNDESNAPGSDCFVGGTLKFYGLFDHPAWKKRGVAITGRAGLLIAYRSNIVHEVTPILEGQRYAIVSRYLAARDE